MVVPGNEVQVVDLDTGATRPAAGPERRVAGPRPVHDGGATETDRKRLRRTIRDGFIYTGDIGYLDQDGFLFITDPQEGRVFVKGFNVFPREVEEVIHTCPNVDMVGVVGVPDARSGGERLVAFVAPRKGEKGRCGRDLYALRIAVAGYKCPTEVRVVRQLPLNQRSEAGPHRTSSGCPQRARAVERNQMSERLLRRTAGRRVGAEQLCRTRYRDRCRKPPVRRASAWSHPVHPRRIPCRRNCNAPTDMRSPTAGNFSGGIRVFAIIHSEGKKIPVIRSRIHARRDQHDGVSIPRQYGAIGRLSNFSGFQSQRTSADSTVT